MELPAERRDRLGARIEAARARAAARRNLDWAEVGDLLESLSHDLNAITHLQDDAAQHAQYDEIERRLDEVEARLSGAAEREGRGSTWASVASPPR